MPKIEIEISDDEAGMCAVLGVEPATFAREAFAHNLAEALAEAAIEERAEERRNREARAQAWREAVEAQRRDPQTKAGKHRQSIEARRATVSAFLVRWWHDYKGHHRQTATIPLKVSPPTAALLIWRGMISEGGAVLVDDLAAALDLADKDCKAAGARHAAEVLENYAHDQFRLLDTGKHNFLEELDPLFLGDF